MRKMRNISDRTELKWRVRIALNVLRGRPVMYRILVQYGTVVARDNTMIVECTFNGGGHDGTAIDVLPGPYEGGWIPPGPGSEIIDIPEPDNEFWKHS